MNYSELAHTGVAHDANPPGRGSGRFPYGSGENPGQHEYDFLGEVKRLKAQGFTESEIARTLIGKKGVNPKTGEPVWATSTDLRARMSIETTKKREDIRRRGMEAYDRNHGNMSAAAREMGMNESSLRSYLDDDIAERQKKYENTAEFLKSKVEEKGFIDVSSGTELLMGCTDYTKKVAVAMLKEEGYVETWIQIPTGKDKNTTVKVLARKPEEGETELDVRRWVQQNKYNVGSIQEFTPDDGKTWWTPEFPEMLDSKRVMVRYAEDGGTEKDGVIELRRGVEDISLDKSQYAQVRIAIDGTNYLKGMAIYADDADFPPGVDVIFNTNKHVGTPLIDTNAVYTPGKNGKEGTWSGKEVSKRLKINEQTGEVDRENPFGALIKSPKEVDGVVMAGGQRKYIGADGKEHLSPINKLRDEGDWDSWSRALASQFLSKQPEKLIKQQLDLTVLDKKAELDQIERLTNPVIKKKLLEEFADSCDAGAAELTAKGFKGQAYQVLLPSSKVKAGEIYAPNYQDGDTLALVRYPHGGVFEIPVLKVNNSHADQSVKNILMNSKDAVVINSKTAQQLSGADFDGDTALVFSVKGNRLNINSAPYLEGLKDFDPKSYKLPDSAPPILNRTKQNEMGKATNLITDMTVGGASLPEIEKAVKHSMVVIDSEKHHLNYKQSYIDYGIEDLKRRYQGETKTGGPAGASTILSKANSDAYINRRKEVRDTKKMTPAELERYNKGYKIYRDTGETSVKLITDPKKMTSDELERYNAGKKVFRDTGKPKQITVPRMYTVDDARDLVRDRSNKTEMIYANFANELKSLALKSRSESRQIENINVSKEARATYAAEVKSLNAKLRIAESNAPRERKARALANSMMQERLRANPGMDYEHRSREEALCLTKARAAVGAKKRPIDITDREWEAIQANAVSSSKLARILNNTNEDKFKQRATPRQSKGTVTQAMINKAKAMANSGMYSTAEIADSLGVSTSTISGILSA